MLFNSGPFLSLLLVTFVLYYLPFMARFQVVILTVASFVFYAWERPILVFLLLASILINAITSYLVAVGSPSRQRLWVVIGVGLNLALLIFFKYSPLIGRTFWGDSPNSIGEFLILIPLPIGISFFTFQGISLMVEVFRHKTGAQEGSDKTAVQIVPVSFGQHLKNTALFKSFFPYLVAGPIVKAKEFYPQIGVKKLSHVDWQAAFRALVVGYFLKMVIADNLKDQTYWLEYPYFQLDSVPTLIALLVGYSMQIFADFAGYSLIAIGLAHLFGFSLPTNFNFPYISRSFSEFWRRWHISLSSWLREYLYLPLGGNRKGPVRTYFNLFVVMFLGGLWHGAAWSYAVWGTFHGVALAAERLMRDRVRLPRHWLIDAVRVLIVFSFVTLAWLLFKLPNFHHVLAYLAMFVHNENPTRYLIVATIIAYSAPIGLYYLWHLLKRHTTLPVRRYEFVAYAGLLVAIVLNSGSAGRFIYFQF